MALDSDEQIIFDNRPKQFRFASNSQTKELTSSIIGIIAVYYIDSYKIFKHEMDN